MNINLIPTTAGIQSSIGMSGHDRAFGACTGALTTHVVRVFDLAQGVVGFEPATARQGWVQGTPAWRPPLV